MPAIPAVHSPRQFPASRTRCVGRGRPHLDDHTIIAAVYPLRHPTQMRQEIYKASRVTQHLSIAAAGKGHGHPVRGPQDFRQSHFCVSAGTNDCTVTRPQLWHLLSQAL